MSQEREIDNLIQQIQETECGGDGLPKGGILSLVAPIKVELKAAQVINLSVRRGLLNLQVKQEQEIYEQELYELGKSIWAARC